MVVSPIIAVITGITFLVLMLVIAIFIPKPTKFQYNVFKTIIAISVAGFAVAIPGLLEVKIGNIVKAGSAIAVFILVYFYNPADLFLKRSSDESGESENSEERGKLELADIDLVPNSKYQLKQDPNKESIDIQPTQKEE